jgi:signal transduction histidine kinase
MADGAAAAASAGVAARRGWVNQMALTGTQRDPRQLLRQLDELEREVASLSVSLEHRERMASLGTIAALIAHEFNNVLTPVRTYAQMALAKPEDRELVTKALRRAAEGAERATQIAGVILGFVREPAGAGSRSDEQTAVGEAEVSRVVDEALACLVRDPEREGIHVAKSCPKGLWVGIRPVALQHVLLNLLLNARAAMLPGGGTLTISAGRATGDELNCSTWNILSTGDKRRWVRIGVTDTGRGMSVERLKATPKSSPADVPNVNRLLTSEGGASAGLGLKFCQRLLAEVGGSLSISSAEGKGTTCTVLVPESLAAERGLRQSA